MIQKLREKLYNLLRKSERFTKTDMVYLTKGGGWLGSGQAVTTLLSFLLVLGFANFLSQDTYGIYKYVLSVAGIIAGFSLTGLNTAIIRAVASGYEYLAKHSLLITLRWSAAVVIIALGASGYYFFNDNTPLALSMLIIAIFQPFLSGFSTYGSYLNGRKQYQHIATFQVLRNGIPAAVLLGTIFLTDNPILIVLAYFISHTLVTGSIYLFIHKRFPPNNRKDDGASLQYAKHLSIIKLLSNFANRFGDIIIFQLLGATPLALYAIANAIPAQIIALTKHLDVLALPKFSIRDKEEIKDQLFSKINVLIILGIIVYIPYYFLIPFLFDLFFPQYTDAVFIARLLGINIILALSTSLAGTFFDSQYETKLKYTMNVSVGITKPTLMFIFLLLMGLPGVVVGELITRLLLLIAFAFSIRYV